MLPPKDTITIWSSSAVTHPSLHRTPYTLNDPRSFIFHTSPEDPLPTVIVHFKQPIPSNLVYLYNRTGAPGIAERFCGVELAVSKDGIKWRSISPSAELILSLKTSPLCIEMQPSERYLKLFRSNRGAAIHIHQISLGRPLHSRIERSLTRAFAHSYNLPIDQEGCIVESRDPVVQEAARMVLRPGSHPIQSHPPPLSAVRIRFLGRFSNALVQISNAIRIAHKLKLNTVYLPTSERSLAMFNSHEMGCNELNMQLRIMDPPSTTTVLEGFFFYSEKHKQLLEGTPTRHRAIQAFKHNLGFDYATNAALPRDTLVMHIRSGDIFSDTPHRAYGQPPLAYYKLVIEKANPRSVLLVYENEHNPVIPALHALLKSLSIPYTVQCSSLREDVALLLRATTLVSGRGTFVSGITALSNNVKEVYSFEANTSWNPGTANHVIHDISGGYRSEILGHNWRNSAEQRQMMISYPASCLAFGKQPAAQP